MSENYFQPWISDKEPKAPEDWGLDALRSNPRWTCNGCGEMLKMRDQYLYQYRPQGTIIVHNKQECFDKVNSEITDESS